MLRRTFKVVGHGEGPIAKKAVDLALKHSRAEVTGIDLEKSRYGRYLKQRRLLNKPKNLTVLSQNSLHFLEKQKDNSIHHQYAHFSSTAMSFYARRRLYSEVFRTLVPGGRFTVIDAGNSGIPLLKELRKNGFKAKLTFMSDEQVKKMDTPDADLFHYYREKLREPQKGDLNKAEKEFFEERINSEPIVDAEVREYARDLAKGIMRGDMGRFAKIVAIKPRK